MTQLALPTKKQRIKALSHVKITGYCKCGHSSLIHGDKGTGACEGTHSPYDGPYATFQDCTCREYEAAK